MSKTESTVPTDEPCRSCPPLAATHAEPPSPAGAHLFRIQTMDCAVEKAEIRRALEPVAGIQSLSFQLGARTLAIKASAPALDLALAAIRRVGLDPQPLNEPAAEARGGIGNGLTPLLLALALALSAEGLAFMAAPNLATTLMKWHWP